MWISLWISPLTGDCPEGNWNRSFCVKLRFQWTRSNKGTDAGSLPRELEPKWYCTNDGLASAKVAASVVARLEWNVNENPRNNEEGTWNLDPHSSSELDSSLPSAHLDNSILYNLPYHIRPHTSDRKDTAARMSLYHQDGYASTNGVTSAIRCGTFVSHGADPRAWLMHLIRLNFQHHLWKEILGNNIKFSLQDGQDVRIADVGTGTGYVELCLLFCYFSNRKPTRQIDWQVNLDHAAFGSWMSVVSSLRLVWMALTYLLSNSLGMTPCRPTCRCRRWMSLPPSLKSWLADMISSMFSYSLLSYAMMTRDLS